MIAIVKDEEIQRIGYYAVIPATVLFNERLKPNEKLLYALITALSNKEGYCYGVRIDIWTHFMRGCIIDYVH